MLCNVRKTIFIAATLAIAYPLSVHAQRSSIENNNLLIPRIDIVDSESLELTFRIELEEEYSFILEEASASAQGSSRSGIYDSDSQLLVLNEIELESGDVYSASLHLASQDPEIVFRLSDAELVYPALPLRSGLRPRTTSGIPHTQIDVEPVAEINAELFERVYSVPDIEQQIAVNSIADTWGLWLGENVNLVNSAVSGGREIAHIHPDGSLHATLDPIRALEAQVMGWAILHPFALEQQAGWDGYVLLYTPQSLEELDVVFQLILDSYYYITGRNLEASDYH